MLLPIHTNEILEQCPVPCAKCHAVHFLFPSAITRWVPEEWGPCSVSCGLGVQTRLLSCKIRLSQGHIVEAAQDACTAPPSVSRAQVGADSHRESLEIPWYIFESLLNVAFEILYLKVGLQMLRFFSEGRYGHRPVTDAAEAKTAKAT